MKKVFSSYKKEISILLLVIFIVIASSTYVTYSQLSDSLSSSYYNKLSVLKNSLNRHISTYFENKDKTAKTIASTEITRNSMIEFKEAFDRTNDSEEIDNKYFESEVRNYQQKINYTIPFANKKRELKEYIPKSESTKVLQNDYVINNPFSAKDRYRLFSSKKYTAYDKVHMKYHKHFLNQLKIHSFYDIFLIDERGNIVYSVFKEMDFATNVKDGVYASSSLGDSFRKAMKADNKDIVFSDFKPYEPSYNKPAAFITIPIHENGNKIGAIAYQISIDEINRYMTLDNTQKSSGLGESGEAYLVGPDYYMRSDSRFLYSLNNPLVVEFGTSIGIVKVESEAVKAALAGEIGYSLVKDYRGEYVYSSYMPLKVFDTTWTIIVETNALEVRDKINKTATTLLLTSVVLVILFLLLIGYLILRLILVPMEKNEDILAENIRLKSMELDTSKVLLDQYKNAVDISSIVSKADKSGHITYVNEAFCKTSGYTKDELIGKSHNILRHPDMPRSTFEELWRTILHKRPWHGVIKNLNKYGEEYYVKSTILPILDDKNNISEFISIRSNITDLIQKERKIIEQTTDIVTSLSNRQKLIEDIAAAKKDLKISIIHLDKFKEINDFYGYEIGDKLLVNIASILKRVVHDSSIKLYKIHGDGFAIMADESLSMDVFANKVSSLIKYFDHNVIVIDDNSFNVSITVGIASGVKSRVYTHAEMALRKALERSESLISYENAHDIEKQYHENIMMTTKIKDAIKNDDIVVFIQPIKSNIAGGKDKYECLVRMIDGKKVVSPFFFLDIAKKARLYPTITRIVIENSFKYFKDKDSEFSINLNIEDILNSDMVAYLKRKIKEYSVGHKLVIELVESEGIENFDEIHAFIQEVKELGCKIAIDDFGTGYSNFEYLMKLDVDFIKVDGSLIKNIDTDENSEVVVALIIDFAKRMNIKTIAEYVHSDEVYKKVKSMGIDYFQGYYLGEPRAFDI